MIDDFSAHQRMRGFSTRTIDRRRWSLTRYAEDIDPRSFGDASASDVERHLTRRYNHPQTIYSILSDIKAFYRWALRRDLVDHDPADRIEYPRLPTRAPTPLTRDELRRLLVAADGSTRIMVLLAVYAGLRVSEIARLEGADIRLDDNALVVRGGKGGKDRVIPLAPVLAAGLAGAPRGPLFPELTGQSVSGRIRHLMRAIGITKRPHDLRATFATEVAKVSNGNLPVIAGLLGHSSYEQSRAYVSWVPDGADVVATLFGDAA